LRNGFIKTFNPTIDDAYRKIFQILGDTYTLEVLDTTGEQANKALRELYVREGDGIVLLYSTTSRWSFNRIRRLQNQARMVQKSTSQLRPGTSTDRDFGLFMLVGSDCDQVDEREVSTKEGQALAEELGCIFIESSAKDHSNLQVLFHHFLSIIRQYQVNVRRKMQT
jgi:GTPase KRas